MNRIAELGAATVKGFGAIAATPIKVGANITRSTLGVATSTLLDQAGITPVTSFFRSISSEIGSTYNSLFGSSGARNRTRTRMPSSEIPSNIPSEDKNKRQIYEVIQNQSQKIDALFDVIKELNNNFLRNSEEQLQLAKTQNLTLKRMNNVLGNFAKSRQNKLRMDRLDRKAQKRILPDLRKNQEIKPQEKRGMFSGLINTLSGLGNLISGLGMLGTSFLRRKGGGIGKKIGAAGLAATPLIAMGSLPLSIIAGGAIIGFMFKDKIGSFLNTMKNSFLDFIQKAENFLNPKAKPREIREPQIAVSSENPRSIISFVNQTYDKIISTNNTESQDILYENLISKLRTTNLSREQLRTILKKTELSNKRINDIVKHVYINNSSSNLTGKNSTVQVLGNAGKDRLMPGSNSSVETRNTFFNNSSNGSLSMPSGFHMTVPIINNNNNISATTSNSSGGNKSKSYGRINATKISNRGSLFHYKAMMA